MNLDLEKIAIARQRRYCHQKGLDYLLSDIRKEQLQRLCEVTSELKESPKSGLVIDFEPVSYAEGVDKSDAYENMIPGEIEYISLLDQDDVSKNKLSRFPDHGFDCVIENLQLTWLDFPSHLSQISRILRPDGFYLFSCFGPDTLYEVWEAWQGLDHLPHTHDFVDMHHLGDALFKVGFQRPVVDAEWIFIDYPDVDALMMDLKGEGFVNIRQDRRKTLTGKNRFSAFKSKINQRIRPESGLKITFEIIYGFGIKSATHSAITETGAINVTPPTL